MRAWKGLKTAMGNVLRVEFKITVEKFYLNNIYARDGFRKGKTRKR